MNETRVAELIAVELAGMRQRRESSARKLHVHLPGHVLARSDGWVVAARWVLWRRWQLEGVTAPRCEAPGCGPRGVGLRVGWSAQTRRTGGLPAVVTWFLDGDPDDLDARNILGVCAGCSQRGHMSGRLVRDAGSGRFVARS